ncbi:hypothetical protein [Cereibacter azotoformans]|uniref:phage tail tip fiber protein n=1 Tax=Cereibacter azotoformans TaxID=43057 RepID=UPI000C6D57B6|nr:hypothetical protein [Cereibacter azotoformans]
MFRVAATDILLDGSVAARQFVVTDFSGNLVFNGALPYGDTRGWGPLPASFAVVARDPASTAAVLQTAPTGYILRLATDAAPQVVEIGRFDCSAGERFVASYSCAGNSGSNAQIGIQYVWFDADGAVVANTGRYTTVTTVAWQSVTTPAATAPAGAAKCVLRAVRIGGGSGFGFLTNMEVIKQRSGQTLVTPNSLTTELVNTDSFSAAGLAVFGGELRSDNYNAATGTGWQLTKAGGLVVPNASITNAKIGNEIQSNNFVAGSSGWRIRKDGLAEFDSVIIRRNMRVATGTFSIDWTRPGVASTGDWDRSGEVDTGHPAPLWSELKKVYIATLGLTNDAVATADYPEITDQVWWDWNADTIINRTTWFGGATIRFRWAFRGDQFLKRIQGTVRWSLYEVT